MNTFELDQRLQQDTYHIGDWPLCTLLLHKDSNYPWCILVPRRPGIVEIHQLDSDDQTRLIRESTLLTQAMTALFSPDKLNIAALGNIVPQLHLHHIARYRVDPAWPAPVWGAIEPVAYKQDLATQRIESLQQTLEASSLMF
ncbi:MAG TPA: HIT family protein [Porticoccaceae bacterium]|nr:HIT family protein [Porticoccaceae bacterium]